jgi:hypothetical protein
MEFAHVSLLDLIEEVRITSRIKLEMEFEAVKDQLILNDLNFKVLGCQFHSLG